MLIKIILAAAKLHLIKLQDEKVLCFDLNASRSNFL